MEAIAEWWRTVWTGSPVYIAGQIVGLFCTLWSIVIFFPKKRTTILKLKLVSDLLIVAQSAMIGAMMGTVLNGIMVFREIVFINRGRTKWASRFFWFPFFLCVVTVSPAVSVLLGKEPLWLAVLPAAGSMIAVVGYFQMNVNRTRYLAFLANLPWLAYDILVHNLGTTLSAVITGVSVSAAIVTNFVRDRKNARRESAPCTPES